MVSITVLLVAAEHASMAVAGLAVAGYTLGQAVTGPVRGRLADRHGLVPVAAACGTGYALALLALLAGAMAGAPGRTAHRGRDGGRPGQPAAQPGPAQPVVRTRGRPVRPDRVRAGRRRDEPGLHRRPGAGQRPGHRPRPGRGPGPAARADRRGDGHHRQAAADRPAGHPGDRPRATRRSDAPGPGSRSARPALGRLLLTAALVERGAQRERGRADRIRPASPRPVGRRPAAGRGLDRQHPGQPAARRPLRIRRPLRVRRPLRTSAARSPGRLLAAGRLRRRPGPAHRGRPRRRRCSPWPPRWPDSAWDRPWPPCSARRRAPRRPAAAPRPRPGSTRS